jgi:hypothetical protein
MTIPHKHAAIIKAWADGKDIERKVCSMFGGIPKWVSDHNPKWDLNTTYRVKPVDEERKVNTFFASIHSTGSWWVHQKDPELSYKDAYERNDSRKHGALLGIISYTVDHTDGRVVSARVCDHDSEF